MKIGCTDCGTKYGYTYRRSEDFEVVGCFDEGKPSETAEHIEVIRETKPRCCGCGKLVTMPPNPQERSE